MDASRQDSELVLPTQAIHAGSLERPMVCFSELRLASVFLTFRSAFRGFNYLKKPKIKVKQVSEVVFYLKTKCT